jgi:hypothetical protein
MSLKEIGVMREVPMGGIDMSNEDYEEHIVRRPSKAKVALSWTSKEFDVANEYWKSDSPSREISYREESSTVRNSGCRAMMPSLGHIF